MRNMTFVFVVGFVALVLLAIYAYCSYINNNKEPFVGNTDVICTNVLQHREWASSRGFRVKAVPFDETMHEKLIADLNKPNVVMALSKSQNVMFVMDPLDAMRNTQLRRARNQAPKGYFVAIYTLNNAMGVSCSFDLQGKRVGYMDRSDLLFIKALTNSYRMEKTVSQLKQIPISQWDILARLLETDLDVIITYVIPGSDFHRLLQTQDLSMMGFKSIDGARVKAFYPFVDFEQVNIEQVMRHVPGSALKFMAKEKDTVLPSMRMSIVMLRGSYREGFEDQGSVILRSDPEELDPSYRCYGDLSIEQKSLCNSPYDAIGLRKRKPTVWDRPCIRNEDCPFYKANTNYKNTRGKCLDGGLCEMPVGVKRIAYRLYDATGINAPFCYGCKNPTDTTCCSSQRFPDYAFENDHKDRKAARMTETIIAMK